MNKQFKHPLTSVPMTASFCCHLDDRRGLFVRRDFSSHTRRNDSVDVTFFYFHLMPNKNWATSQDDCQTERCPRLKEQFLQGRAGKSVFNN